MNFKKDLKTGKEIEHEVCIYLQTKYPDAYVVDGYCKEHDIVIPSIDITVEVKADFKSEETGNYLIEKEFGDEPSALSTTEADWWIIVDNEHYLWVRPDSLEEICRYEKPVKLTGRGDDTEKTAYLIDCNKLLHSPYVDVVERHL